MSIHLRIYSKDDKQKDLSNDLETLSADPVFLIKLLVEENNVFCGVRGVQQNVSPPSSTPFRSHLSSFVRFVAHFFLVIGSLYLSAMIFSHLEDERKGNACKANKTNVAEIQNASSFHLTNTNDLTDCDIEDIALFIERIRSRRTVKVETDVNSLQKWFYFSLIATTTIGYGDVHPETQSGKIFYCCFSVIGIILMMSLLKSCGAILNAINKGFYRFVRRHLLLGMDCWSEELLSLVSLIFFFVSYLSLGIWHDTLDVSDDHSIVDIIYFWVATFTTVGFGDVGHSLEYEIQHAYELTVYRIFGLSLVAAVIDLIQSYLLFRKHKLQVEAAELQKILLERLHSSILESPLLCKGGVYDEDKYNVSNAMRDVALNSLDYHKQDSV